MSRRQREAYIPPHVMEMAQRQAKHIEAMLKDSEHSEVEREARIKKVPLNRREIMAELFDKERADERLQISRLREDHAALLHHHIKLDRGGYGPDAVGALRQPGDFVPDGTGVPGLYADKPYQEKPGTTSQHLAFMKETFKLTDPDRATRRSSVKSTARRGGSGRTFTSRSHFGSMPVDREALLAHKAILLERLSHLSSVEEKMVHDGASGGGIFTGRSSQQSGRMPMSARSTTSSVASGATFCDLDAPVKWKQHRPRNVPPLQKVTR